jgi:hypothetical protein
MKVIDFIDEFLKIHRGRYVPHDWPEHGSEDWLQYRRLWVSAFLDRKVQKHEADTASVRCGTSPPRFRNDHLPRIISEIEALRLANQILNVPDDREIAMEKSRDCPHCDVSGFRIVYHPKYEGKRTVVVQRNGKIVLQPGTVATTCSCLYGQWVRNHIEPDTLRILPELRRILDGHSSWHYFDPTDVDALDDPPVSIGDILSRAGVLSVTVGVDSSRILKRYDVEPAHG